MTYIAILCVYNKLLFVQYESGSLGIVKYLHTIDGYKIKINALYNNNIVILKQWNTKK